MASKTQTRYALLTADILKAKEVAAAAAQAHNAECDAKGLMRDGGTCNMDSMFLDVGRESTIKRSSAALKAALKAANDGHEPCHKSYGWRKGFWLGGCWGQGHRNEVAVKAGVAFMKEKGWPVSYWAAMD